MKIQFAVLLLSLFAVPSYGRAMGGVDGGGGKSVVCRDDANVITSAETLDLFEARHLYGLEPKKYQGSMKNIIEEVKKNLENTMDQPEVHLFYFFDLVMTNMRFVPPEIVLKPIDDAAEIVVPRGCKLEQLAYYVDDELLLVSLEIWNALDEINRAALVSHEAIYRMERTSGAKNSRRARKIVAHLFSNFSLTQVRSGLPSEAPTCMAMRGDKVTYHFSYVPSQTGGHTQLQFFTYESKTVFSKKTAVLPILLPWRVPFGCNRPQDGCNISGGSISSNFEGSGFITLGVEENPTSKLKFYFLDQQGRNYLNCAPHEASLQATLLNERPLVRTFELSLPDGGTLNPDWFSVDMKLQNFSNQELTVTAVEFLTISESGFSSASKHQFKEGLRLEPSQAINAVAYASNLRRHEVDSLEYNVRARILGFLGGDPGKPIEASLGFKTR